MKNWWCWQRGKGRLIRLDRLSFKCYFNLVFKNNIKNVGHVLNINKNNAMIPKSLKLIFYSLENLKKKTIKWGFFFIMSWNTVAHFEFDIRKNASQKFAWVQQEAGTISIAKPKQLEE